MWSRSRMCRLVMYQRLVSASSRMRAVSVSSWNSCLAMSRSRLDLGLEGLVHISAHYGGEPLHPLHPSSRAALDSLSHSPYCMAAFRQAV
jgi:hypothetical protein